MPSPYKKVLVTGGAGFIGSFVVEALLASGREVVIFDNLEPQVHNGKIPPYLTPKAEFICGDVRDREALKRVVPGADAIFHLAAAVGVGQSMYEVKKYVDVNCGGTANLLDILANEKHEVKKLIVASSMSIYGEGYYRNQQGRDVNVLARRDADLAAKRWECFDPEGNAPLTPLPTPESKPCNPTSIYAITKKTQEDMVMVFGPAYKIPTVALRFFNCYGPRQSLKNPYTGVAAIFASKVLTGQPPTIFEDGRQSRDFVAVEDLVQANLMALEHDAANYEVFNVGSGSPITVQGVAEAVIKASGSSLGVNVTHEYRRGDIRHCFADISRIQKKLGYKPRINMLDGMKNLIGQSQQDALEKQAHPDSLEELKRRKLLF
jgi:dTDP-L-rhamnose 4-epimerase